MIGGGVIGLTTAVALQAAGFTTTIFEDRPPASSSRSNDPDYASLHAAASILPHSVRTSRANEWTATSTRVLDLLAESGLAGIRSQRHFEMFEHSTPLPSYASAVDDFHAFEKDQATNEGIPQRESAEVLVGWSFRAWFCEAPVYLKALRNLYRSIGGSTVVAQTSIEQLASEGWRAIALCAGHRSAAMTAEVAGLDAGGKVPDLSPVRDPFEAQFILGHYLTVPIEGLLLGKDNTVVSYNYHPAASVYTDPYGHPADVYCYPRSDRWLLGGTRRPYNSLETALTAAYDLNQPDCFKFPDSEGRTIQVPQQILTLNRELIDSLAQDGLNLDPIADDSDQITAGIGLRAERSDPNDSTRVEASLLRVNGQRSLLVHNYGHGGAGFTLSWGCASDIGELVARLGDEAGIRPTAANSRGPLQESICAVL